MIHVSPFQLRIFCDSMIVCQRPTKEKKKKGGVGQWREEGERRSKKKQTMGKQMNLCYL